MSHMCLRHRHRCAHLHALRPRVAYSPACSWPHTLRFPAACLVQRGCQPITAHAVCTHAHALPSQVLKAVFQELVQRGVNLAGIVLKPNMVLPGASSRAAASDAEVAGRTLDVLLESVPPQVGGECAAAGPCGSLCRAPCVDDCP
jgi:hypothetical protein